MKRIFILPLTLFLFNAVAYAQISTHEKPIGYNSSINLKESSRSSKSRVITPPLDMKVIEEEDKKDAANRLLPRFGYPHHVSLDLNNSGIWYTLPNGDKLWKLNIVCPDALSVNLYFGRFWLPDGCKLFIYTRDMKHSIGAFTSRNNKGKREDKRGFATELVFGNDIILEYYQPKETFEDAILSLNTIVHGYRRIKDFAESGTCNVNVNCEEGLAWQREKKAVALVLVGVIRDSTGSLLNTTSQNQAPLFLTGNHCVAGYDAMSSPNLDDYVFYWNYEAPGCVNPSSEPEYYTTSGATLLANNQDTDFALLRLTEDPRDIIGFSPYYLGWDKSGSSGNPGVCIHHPMGDVKKISTVKNQPNSTDAIGWTGLAQATHWEVTWKQTLNGHGITESGSSGSPLLNAEHKVIGQLHGGSSSCENLNSSDKYGRFDLSWIGNGNASPYRRLDCWLDSLNMSPSSMEGLMVVSDTLNFAISDSIHSNFKVVSGGRINVFASTSLLGNSYIIVQNGGLLVIDGCTLYNADIRLEQGASLKIINGGVIQCRNGFYAPLGVNIEIDEGKIS